MIWQGRPFVMRYEGLQETNGDYKSWRYTMVLQNK
jgi:hypothetical protein